MLPIIGGGNDLGRRLDLTSNADERDAMISAMAAQVEERPADEAIALDLARILWGFDRRREALDALVAASDRMPGSQAIEAQALRYFERLHDDRGRVEYLTRRYEAAPTRSDLGWQLVDGLMRQDRVTEALEIGERILADLDREQQAAAGLN